MPIRYKPRVQEQGQQLVLNRPNASAASFGGAEARSEFGQAQQIGQVGQAVGQLGEAIDQYGRQVDSTMAGTAYTNYHQEASNLKEQLTRGKTGLELKGATEEYGIALKKLKDDKLKGLENQRQKDLFQASADPLSVKYTSDVEGVEVKQMEVAQRANRVVQIETAKQDAITNLSDPVYLDAANKVIESNIKANNPGATPKVVDFLIKKEKDGLQTSRFYSILEGEEGRPGSALTAQKYLRDNANEFLPDTRTRLEKTVNNLADIEKGENQAQELINQGMSLSEQLKELNKIKDQDVKEAAIKKANNNDVVMKRVEAEENRATYNNMFGKLTQDATTKIPTELAFKDPAKYKSLVAYQQALVAKPKAEQTVETLRNWETLNSMTSDELSKVDMSEYMTKLTTADFKYFSNLQQGYENPKTIQTATDFINTLVKSELGKKPDPEEVSQMKTTFYRRMDALPAELKKTQKGFEMVRDEMLTEVTYQGEWFKGGQQLWETEGQDLESIRPITPPKKIADLGGELEWVETLDQNGNKVTGWYGRYGGENVIYNEKNGRILVTKPYKDNKEVASK